MRKEYVPERKTRTAELDRGESLDVVFSPRNPGWVVAVAEATWKGVRPIARELEITVADREEPVAKRTDDGLGIATLLTHHLEEEQIGERVWRCRVRNLHDGPIRFTLWLLYPGSKEIREQRMSASIIEEFINKLLRGVQIRIARGEKQSVITLPKSFGMEEVRFTTPEFRKKLALLTIRQYPNVLESGRLMLSLLNSDRRFPSGALALTITFDGEGDHLLGTLRGKLRNMLLTAHLGLTTDGEGLTYSRAEVVFDFDLDVKRVPDWLLDPVFRYTDVLRHAVEGNLKALLHRKETREAFARGLSSQVKAVLPEGATLHSVRVAGGEVILRHYVG